MSTSPVVTAPADEQPQISAVGRLIGAIVSPKKTFTDIARRPTWVLPFVALCLLSMVAGALIGLKTDWRSFFERQNAKNSRMDQMSQEQKDNIVEKQLAIAPKMSFVIGAVGIAVVILVVALVYWGAFNLFNGAGLNFKTAFSITNYAFTPIIISSLLAILILLIKHTGDVDPEHFLASSVASFLPDDAPKWLTQLGESLELFWTWSLALVAVGFSAANPKKIKPAGAFITVFGIWIAWIVVKVVWALLF
jgi:Yip1 domain